MKLISFLSLTARIWAHKDHDHDHDTPAENENSNVVVLTDSIS